MLSSFTEIDSAGSKERESSPWGPLTVTSLPLMLISTPLGRGMGIFPTRDIDLLLAYHM
ncbi:hypothetical protein ES703_75904 [subsurface metagenome]